MPTSEAGQARAFRQFAVSLRRTQPGSGRAHPDIRHTARQNRQVHLIQDSIATATSPQGSLRDFSDIQAESLSGVMTLRQAGALLTAASVASFAALFGVGKATDASSDGQSRPVKKVAPSVRASHVEPLRPAEPLPALRVPRERRRSRRRSGSPAPGSRSVRHNQRRRSTRAPTTSARPAPRRARTPVQLAPRQRPQPQAPRLPVPPRQTPSPPAPRGPSPPAPGGTFDDSG